MGGFGGFLGGDEMKDIAKSKVIRGNWKEKKRKQYLEDWSDKNNGEGESSKKEGIRKRGRMKNKIQDREVEKENKDFAISYPILDANVNGLNIRKTLHVHI